MRMLFWLIMRILFFFWVTRWVILWLKVTLKGFFAYRLIQLLSIVLFWHLTRLLFHNVFKILPFLLTSILPLPRPLIQLLGQFNSNFLIIGQFTHQLRILGNVIVTEHLLLDILFQLLFERLCLREKGDWVGWRVVDGKRLGRFRWSAVGVLGDFLWWRFRLLLVLYSRVGWLRVYRGLCFDTLWVLPGCVTGICFFIIYSAVHILVPLTLLLLTFIVPLSILNIFPIIRLILHHLHINLPSTLLIRILEYRL